MRRLAFSLVFMVSLGFSPSSADAQGCCGRSPLIREILQDSDVVWVVRVEFANQDPKSEERDLTILEAFKDHPGLADQQLVRVARAISIPDPKKPPRMLVVGYQDRGQVEVRTGYDATPDMVEYVTGLLRFHPQDRRQTLRFCTRFLESTTAEVQQDAFREFAEAEIADVKAVAETLPAAKLRALVKNAKLSPGHRNLSGYLLAFCGEQKDATLIRQLLESETRGQGAYQEHLFKGYVILKPKEGWKYVAGKMKNKKNDFLDRYSCLRTARYFYEDPQGVVTKKQVVQALDALLDHQDMADFAIEDLRKWNRWEYTARVLSLWGKEGYDTRLVKRAILRFALQSPKPIARPFVADQRVRNQEWVEETEELLKLDGLR